VVVCAQKTLFALPYSRKLQGFNIVVHGVLLTPVGNNYLN
jgi:hypothetical protein